MEKPKTTEVRMVAPCGINCGVCLAYLRDKNRCNGCWSEIGQKHNYCLVCKIKNCENLSATESGFCYECPTFPCKRLKQLDKRYNTRYNLNLLGSLRFIQESGMETFIRAEVKKWKCQNCGGTICVHRDFCLKCGHPMN